MLCSIKVNSNTIELLLFRLDLLSVTDLLRNTALECTIPQPPPPPHPPPQKKAYLCQIVERKDWSIV